MEFLKKLLKSRTVWAGIVQIIASIGMYATGDQSFNELILGGSGVVMIIMRILTKDAINKK